MIDAWTETLAVGIGATLAMDAWGVLRRRLFGIPLNDYGLVGRWVAWMGRGKFSHAAIAKSPAMPNERLVGWLVHYAVGIAFAAALVAMFGSAWLRSPTLMPALLVGIASVAAPFLVMQPGMGAGIAASRSPQPGRARLQSLVNHIVFGLGLYAAARGLTLL